MSDGWLDKAKQAALSAAEEAKKMAESATEAAKNANYGEMFDKAKAMGTQAAEEAKRAAGSVMSKHQAAEPVEPESEAEILAKCNARLAQIEMLLQEVKTLLGKPQ